MKNFLNDAQRDAVSRMRNGCILNGGVGSGKSRTSLAYWYTQCGGEVEPDLHPMTEPLPLYIITTAHKRDSLEWDEELTYFRMQPENDDVHIDSWNNIKKYTSVSGAFFIFDEQRVSGSGAWVKAFYSITAKNRWILLSATPGDTWMDYIPVFVANGFFKNRTEFVREHVVYSRMATFPKIDRYLGEVYLQSIRDKILVNLDRIRNTIHHDIDVYCEYDRALYNNSYRNRWDPYRNEPATQASSMCYILRQIVNSDQSRLVAVAEILEKTPRAIIFYNFDYELDALCALFESTGIIYAQWNGHKHEEVPDCESWVYLVQYIAGAEAWNCITTDTIIFFSQNYSYRVMTQASGRIDRVNTPYTDLYYYHLKSRSSIDLAITRALANKKEFNECRWFGKWS